MQSFAILFINIEYFDAHKVYVNEKQQYQRQHISIIAMNQT